MKSRCFSSSVGRSQHARVYPVISSRTSLVESDAFDRSFNDPGSFSLASEGVILISVAYFGGRTSQAPHAVEKFLFNLISGSFTGAWSCFDVMPGGYQVICPQGKLF